MVGQDGLEKGVTVVGIVGLGLIGGSLGLALASSPGWQVIGYDAKKDISDQAVRLGACTFKAESLEEVAGLSDVLVVAAPSSRIPEVALAAAKLMRPGTIITDVGSVKVPIHRLLDGKLPDGVRYVGGHPMAGSERSGLAAASRDLFRGSVWAVTPCGAEEWAVGILGRMIEATGARMLLVDPGDHDRAVAYTSHLPYLLAVGLALSSLQVKDAIGLVDRLRAGGFRSATRLARSDPSISVDYCFLNRDDLLTAIEGFEEHLNRLKLALRDRDLDFLMESAERARQHLCADRQDGGYRK